LSCHHPTYRAGFEVRFQSCSERAHHGEARATWSPVHHGQRDQENLGVSYFYSSERMVLTLPASALTVQSAPLRGIVHEQARTATNRSRVENDPCLMASGGRAFLQENILAPESQTWEGSGVGARRGHRLALWYDQANPRIFRIKFPRSHFSDVDDFRWH
jgi:hypothetical protein